MNLNKLKHKAAMLRIDTFNEFLRKKSKWELTQKVASRWKKLATENDNTCNYLEPYLESIDNIDFTIENCVTPLL